MSCPLQTNRNRESPTLRLVRIVHTLIWAFFVAVILVMPVAAWQRRWDLFLLLTGLVMLEVGVLAANRLKCPLTDIAAKYTDDRQDNFDIYLPLFLARYNKQIFGSLFLAGLLFGAFRYLQG